MSKRYVVKRDITKHYRVGQITHTVTLRAGLQCRPIRVRGHETHFFLMDLPPDIFPRNSLAYHDAACYGIVLATDEVEDARDGSEI